jgi:DNA-binding NarL/FixJ family response regulator
MTSAPEADAEAASMAEIAGLVADPRYGWARELAEGMPGLRCTVVDVVRMALDELRDRHPSPKRLEEALRRHMWAQRAGGVVSRRRGAAARAVRTARAAADGAAARSAASPGVRVRVLVVHPHPTLRAGLAGVLAGVDGIEVVRESADWAGVARVVGAARPDVVLVDASVTGLEALPGVQVLVLAAPADRERVLAALDAGALGYVPADAAPEELARAIGAAARGESTGGLREALELVGRRSGAPVLTSRERQVLALVGRGLANKQIAGRLGISEKTVKAHLGRTFQRIGVADRTQAALWAERNGVGDAES